MIASGLSNVARLNIFTSTDCWVVHGIVEYGDKVIGWLVVEDVDCENSTREEYDDVNGDIFGMFIDVG